MTKPPKMPCGYCRCLSICATIALLLPTNTIAYSFSTIINASVLGTPESNDAALYSSIAEIMLREDSADKINTPQAPSYCKLLFTALNFDTSSGDAMYNSLQQARQNFEDKKVAVAIGPFMEVFASTDYVITDRIHILTSAAGQNAGIMDPVKVVSILPEPSSLSQAISETVKTLGWTSVAFLAQDDFSPVLSLRHESISVWPLRLPNVISSSFDTEVQRILIELRESEKEKCILHSNNRNVVMNVLKAANHLHLLHHSIDWFVSYPDFEDFVGGDGKAWPGSLYGLQLLRQEKIPTNISHLSAGNLSRLDLGLAVDVVGLLRHILWSEQGDCSRERLVEDYVIPPETFIWQLKNRTNAYQGALGQYTWDKHSNFRTNFTIDVVKYSGNVTKLGTITFENGIPNVTIQYQASPTKGRLSNVFGQDEILRIATKQTDPFIIKNGNSYRGFSKDLLDRLAEKLKFKYELYEAEDHTDANSEKINGMVYALTSGNASMAVGSLEVTAEREKVISFSYTIMSSQASILIKKADSTINFFQFLGPFSAGLWLMILVFMLVAGVSLFVMSRYDPTQQGNVKHFDLKESLWYSLNIFLQGSTDYSPQTTSMRAIIAFFWFCVLIIEAAYTANLAAYLTLQQIDDRIKSIYDLAGQIKQKYGVEKDSDIMMFFQKKKEDPYERMWAFMKMMESEVMLSNRTEIIEKVKSGKLAFISESVTNGYYANQHCGIESIEQNFQSKDYSLGFPRGAPYLDDINKALLELKEGGVLDSLKERWWSVGRNCTGEDDTRSVSEKTTAELELTNMIGVFIVLAIFIGIAILFDIGERVYRKHQETKKKPTTVELNTPSESNALENHFLK